VDHGIEVLQLEAGCGPSGVRRGTLAIALMRPEHVAGVKGIGQFSDRAMPKSWMTHTEVIAPLSAIEPAKYSFDQWRVLYTVGLAGSFLFGIKPCAPLPTLLATLFVRDGIAREACQTRA